MPPSGALIVGLLIWATPESSPPVETPSAASMPELPEVDEDEAKADAAWALGVAAYGNGELDEAIKQFRETYRYSGSAGPLFSLGQAHRHAYEQTEDDLHRRLAIQSYRAYIDKDPEGKRRFEAESFITELQTEAERDLEGIDRPVPFTGISVTSDIMDARVSVDGADAAVLPASLELDVGRHEVVVVAPGHRPWRRTVEVSEGSTVALVANPQPKPARLTVEGPAGADVYVDGERVARLPAPEGIEVAPGPHQVGVARRGRALFIREVDLGRGEARSMQAELESSGQRKVAVAALAVGGSGLVAAGVLGGLALNAQSRALAIQRERTSAFLNLDHELEGRELQDQRDRLRGATVGTAVVGAVGVVAGVVLYLTDRPPVASQLHGPRDAPPRLQAGPEIGAGRFGLQIGGRF